MKEISNKNIMRNKYKKLLSVMAVVLVVFMISGCGNSQNSSDDNLNGDKTMKLIPLDIDVIKTQTGEDAFNITIEDFIKSFNSFYAAEKGEKYLPEVYKWKMYATGPTFHNSNETMCFAYSEEPEVRSIPQIIVYADSFATGIYQISLSYDDHSYSPETYEIYRELTYYTIRTLYPDKTDKEIKEYTETTLAAVDASFTTDKAAAEASAKMIYNESGAGIYPYYVVGELMEVRIIPLAQ